ncbi:hypothetical protein GOBAR_AA28434 [Gossypium barbadense]|uniref:Uncharacterized protein n=1 Tax=Gossypium barbadense TaxID=3634 RepID=A0A2P5WMC4_GOSBA|nr:hypothetical protein GOBAR_AA28434 [Gossypium barbadense]
MFKKFISVSETRFQNTKIALKNQQTSIQGFKTQVGQLSKLISERPQGSLPSNTEPNQREQLNAINVQNEEGFVEPEPEPRQEPVEMSLKEAHESFSSNSRGPTHEERRLQIEELDEWFSTETRPRARAYLGSCKNRAKISLNMGYDKMPQPCNMAVVEPAKTTWACDTPCGRTVGEPVKTARARDTLVSITHGQHCQNNTGKNP